MVNHDRIRERAERVVEDATVERKWWDEKREQSKRELLGEDTAGSSTSSSDGVLVEKAA